MADKEATATPTPPNREHESDLMGSAKTLVEAAQSGFGKEGKPMDKAEDILEAAKSYGKLDESSGVGQYVDKAEGFLNTYPYPSDFLSAPDLTPAHKEEEEETQKIDSGGDDASDAINMAKKSPGGFF